MYTRGSVVRVVAGAGVVACATALVAGCASKAPGGDGSGGKSDAAHVLDAAASSVSAAKTVTVDEIANINGTGARITGGIDFSGAKLRADLTMKRTGPATPDGLPDRIELILDGTQAYVSTDAFRSPPSGLPDDTMAKALAGKHWIRMPDDDPGSPKSSGPGALQTPGGLIGALALTSDPDLVKAMTALLSSGLLVPDPAPAPGGSFHYTGTLDAASLKTAKFTDAQRSAISGTMQDQDIAAEKIEVWLAPDGLPSEIKFADQGTGAVNPTASSGDVKLSAWGQPVTVTAPAPGDVFDFSQMPQPSVLPSEPGPALPSDFPTSALPALPSGSIVLNGHQ